MALWASTGPTTTMDTSNVRRHSAGSKRALRQLSNVHIRKWQRTAGGITGASSNDEDDGAEEVEVETNNNNENEDRVVDPRNNNPTDTEDNDEEVAVDRNNDNPTDSESNDEDETANDNATTNGKQKKRSRDETADDEPLEGQPKRSRKDPGMEADSDTTLTENTTESSDRSNSQGRNNEPRTEHPVVVALGNGRSQNTGTREVDRSGTNNLGVPEREHANADVLYQRIREEMNSGEQRYTAFHRGALRSFELSVLTDYHERTGREMTPNELKAYIRGLHATVFEDLFA